MFTEGSSGMLSVEGWQPRCHSYGRETGRTRALGFLWLPYERWSTLLQKLLHQPGNILQQHLFYTDVTVMCFFNWTATFPATAALQWKLSFSAYSGRRHVLLTRYCYINNTIMATAALNRCSVFRELIKHIPARRTKDKCIFITFVESRGGSDEVICCMYVV